MESIQDQMMSMLQEQDEAEEHLEALRQAGDEEAIREHEIKQQEEMFNQHRLAERMAEAGTIEQQRVHLFNLADAGELTHEEAEQKYAKMVRKSEKKRVEDRDARYKVLLASMDKVLPALEGVPGRNLDYLTYINDSNYGTDDVQYADYAANQSGEVGNSDDLTGVIVEEDSSSESGSSSGDSLDDTPVKPAASVVSPKATADESVLLWTGLQGQNDVQSTDDQLLRAFSNTYSEATEQRSQIGNYWKQYQRMLAQDRGLVDFIHTEYSAHLMREATQMNREKAAYRRRLYNVVAPPAVPRRAESTRVRTRAAHAAHAAQSSPQKSASERPTASQLADRLANQTANYTLDRKTKPLSSVLFAPPANEASVSADQLLDD